MLARFTRSLNRTTIERNLSAIDVAHAEAEVIDGLPGDRPLRLHVVGDCATNAAAKIVSEASDRYRARHDQPVFTYTHGWRDVARGAWGSVSVLASCEHPAELGEARARGYATALVVADHPSDRRYELDGEQVIPCPFETRGARCSDCLLCTRDTFLHESGRSIAFAAHGGGRSRVLKLLAGDPG